MTAIFPLPKREQSLLRVIIIKSQACAPCWHPPGKNKIYEHDQLSQKRLGHRIRKQIN